jgi:hypothetical protein
VNEFGQSFEEVEQAGKKEGTVAATGDPKNLKVD